MAACEYKIKYFAMLREQRGVDAEVIRSDAVTAQDLYAELQCLHGFGLPTDRLKVAVNQRYASWDTPLTSGDEVVFIPPVAGG